MSESKDAKKIKTIGFRLTDEEYALAESAAIAAGDESPSSWCRTLVLQQANSGYKMTKNQRLIYEEIASAIPRREWIQDVVWVRTNHGCNVEEDNGGRRSEFRDHRQRPHIKKAIVATPARITHHRNFPLIANLPCCEIHTALDFTTGLVIA